MKIEGSPPDQVAGTKDAGASENVDRVQLNRGKHAERAADRGGDRVELSSDARLMSSAVRAAERSPEVRQDVVERARKKMVAGELGRDVEKLADRIIDSLLSR